MMMSAWVVSVRGLSLSSHDVVLGYHLPAGCEPAAFGKKLEFSNRISTMKCCAKKNVAKEIQPRSYDHNVFVGTGGEPTVLAYFKNHAATMMI
jgi:hypothetical protein